MNRQPDSTIPLTQSNLINLFYLSSTSLKSNIHKHLLKNVCSITEDEIRIDELSLHFDPFTFNGNHPFRFNSTLIRGDLLTFPSRRSDFMSNPAKFASS
jgi:hypothetical protein